MQLDRRELIVSGAAASFALAAGVGASAAQGDKAVLKLSSQEGIIPGRDLPEKLARMEKWGFEGLELGTGNLAGRVPEIQKALANTRIKVSAICAGTPGGFLISQDPASRDSAVKALKELAAPAAALGSTGIIIVPAFNGQTTLDNKEARKILVGILPALGDYCHSAGTRLLLEPLNRGEAFFLRQLADAASICRDANSLGVCMMGDFYHMKIEETSDQGAFLSAGKYLHHVHLASRKRVLPGQDERDFTDGFKGLKAIGYQDFCSLECGCDGDRDVEIPKSAKLLKEQWKKA